MTTSIQDEIKVSLSVRARRVLGKLGVTTATEFLGLDRERLLGISNCGKKTTEEILWLRDRIAIRQGSPIENSATEALPSTPKSNLERFSPAMKRNVFEGIRQMLSARAMKMISNLGITDLEGFLSLNTQIMRKEENIGKKTIVEIEDIQNALLTFAAAYDVTVYKSQGSLRAGLWDSLLAIKESEAGWLLAPDTAYESMIQWVSFVAKSDKSKRAFMLRMGLYGKKAMTLQETGQELGVTRERVRQMNSVFARSAQSILHNGRLKEIVRRIGELIRRHGGKLGKEQLLTTLAENPEAASKLKNATPFIDFMADLPVWRYSGLIVRDDAVFDSNFHGS